jgi:hypothetical protein
MHFETLYTKPQMQVESMKKKLPWLKYDMRKKQYIEAKEKEKMAKRNRDEIAKLIAEQKAPIEYY